MKLQIYFMRRKGGIPEGLVLAHQGAAQSALQLFSARWCGRVLSVPWGGGDRKVDITGHLGPRFPVTSHSGLHGRESRGNPCPVRDTPLITSTPAQGGLPRVCSLHRGPDRPWCPCRPVPPGPFSLGLPSPCAPSLVPVPLRPAHTSLSRRAPTPSLRTRPPSTPSSTTT